MLLLKMAFRNIFRQKRRSFFTSLSMIGGFTLAAIFIGWGDGTYNDIIDTFTRTRLGHIQIHEKTYLDRPSLYKTIDDPKRLAAILEQTEGVQAWSPRLYSSGLASVSQKSAGVRIIGIDPRRESEAMAFADKIIRGRALLDTPSMEAVVGKGLAQILAADIGEEIVILSQAADGSIANDLYTIVGIAQTGDDAPDRISLYLHLRDAQDLLVLGDRIHEIAVIAEKLGRVAAVNKRIAAAVQASELTVEPWQVFARSFYEAMQADKAGSYVMLIVIVFIVAVGVLNTVLMSVLERQREYGIMKAVGTKPRQILLLVLMEVVLLAVMCSLIGAGLGFGANTLLSKYGIDIGEGFSYGGMKFHTMRAEINTRSFVIPAVTILFSAALISLFPGLKAARTEPARTMRMH